MSIIEDVFARAGLTEVKVEDLRPGDTIILWEPYECGIYEGIFVNMGSTEFAIVKDDSGYEQSLYLGAEQCWYLVERAPVEEPTGRCAVVEVNGAKYSRVLNDDVEPWVQMTTPFWYAWEDLIEKGVPKILFEGISE